MSSGTLPIADVSKQTSPALAGLNSQEPAKVSTAYAVPVDNYEPSAAVVVAM
jgi:hypothetical protein